MKDQNQLASYVLSKVSGKVLIAKNGTISNEKQSYSSAPVWLPREECTIKEVHRIVSAIKYALENR